MNRNPSASLEICISPRAFIQPFFSFASGTTAAAPENFAFDRLNLAKLPITLEHGPFKAKGWGAIHRSQN